MSGFLSRVFAHFVLFVIEGPLSSDTLIISYKARRLLYTKPPVKFVFMLYLYKHIFLNYRIFPSCKQPSFSHDCAQNYLHTGRRPVARCKNHHLLSQGGKGWKIEISLKKEPLKTLLVPMNMMMRLNFQSLLFFFGARAAALKNCPTTIVRQFAPLWR